MSMSTPSFFFFRNSKKNKSTSGLPPYSKRALIAVTVAIPMAFGLNIPLNTFGAFMPVWGIIMINVIIIISYMEFILPRISKLLSS